MSDDSWSVTFIRALPEWDTSEDDPEWDLTTDEISAVNDMMTAFERQGREFTEQDLIDTVNARRGFKKELRQYADQPDEAKIKTEMDAFWAASKKRIDELNLEHIHDADKRFRKLYGTGLPVDQHNLFLREYNQARKILAQSGQSNLFGQNPEVVDLSVTTAVRRVYSHMKATTVAKPFKPDDPNVDTTARAWATKRLNILRATGEGDRNNTLNLVSFDVGRVVGGGFIEEYQARQELISAAIFIGLEPNEYEPTIESGLVKGMQAGWNA